MQRARSMTRSPRMDIACSRQTSIQVPQLRQRPLSTTAFVPVALGRRCPTPGASHQESKPGTNPAREALAKKAASPTPAKSRSASHTFPHPGRFPEIGTLAQTTATCATAGWRPLSEGTPEVSSWHLTYPISNRPLNGGQARRPRMRAPACILCICSLYSWGGSGQAQTRVAHIGTAPSRLRNEQRSQP